MQLQAGLRVSMSLTYFIYLPLNHYHIMRKTCDFDQKEQISTRLTGHRSIVNSAIVHKRNLKR